MLATDTSVYLFILEACLCPFGRLVKFETKRENPFFLRHAEQHARPAAAWTSAPSSDGVWWKTRTSERAAHTHAGMHSKATHARGGRKRTHPLPLFLLPSALPFSPGRFRVPQMCHQTLVSIWTWGKKEILDRKVYKKRTLWIFDILCTAASKWVGWRGKEKQLQDTFLFICCLFSLSSFREMEASTRPQLTHPCIEGLSAGPWKRNRHG